MRYINDKSRINRREHEGLHISIYIHNCRKKEIRVAAKTGEYEIVLSNGHVSEKKSAKAPKGSVNPRLLQFIKLK